MPTVSQLREDIGAGGLDGVFRGLQPPGVDGPDGALACRARWLGVVDEFLKRYGDSRDAGLFSTPGRTEIGGNHTDHQHGRVLAGSVNLDIAAVAAPNGTGVVRLASEGFSDVEVDLSRLVPDGSEANDSRALVRGVAAEFIRRGHPVRGYDVAMTSSVLKGSGLSSSAAFEVMLGTIVNELFAGGRESPVEIAKIGRYAENHFFGKPCGLMDQVACCVGGVVFIDFGNIDDPRIRRVPFDLSRFGLGLCIIDSGADHADLTDAYSPIPGEMRAAAACFGREFLGDVERGEFLRGIPLVRERAGDRAVQRALHFFAENVRAREEAEAIGRGDIDSFLRLVNESGRSSHMYLQNVFPPGDSRHQAVGVALALCDEFLGGRGAFRVHGGGFAGTVQAFVPLDMLSGFKRDIEAAMGAGCCHVLEIRARGSARIA